MQSRCEGTDIYRWVGNSNAWLDVPIGACWYLCRQPEDDVGYRGPHSFLGPPEARSHLLPQAQGPKYKAIRSGQLEVSPFYPARAFPPISTLGLKTRAGGGRHNDVPLTPR